MNYENSVHLDLIDFYIANFNVATNLLSNSIKGDEIIVGNMRVAMTDAKSQPEASDKELDYVINRFDDIEKVFSEIHEVDMEEKMKMDMYFEKTMEELEAAVNCLAQKEIEIDKEIENINDLKISILRFTHEDLRSHNLLDNELLSFNNESGWKIEDEKKTLFKRKSEYGYKHDMAKYTVLEFNYKVGLKLSNLYKS